MRDGDVINFRFNVWMAPAAPLRPHCARPVAAAQPRCVYCGGELPAEAVAAAAAAARGPRGGMAREGASKSPGSPPP